MFEGKGSENRLRPNKKCKHCKKAGKVYFTGTSVDHGNPFTPAADTEVTHYYECENCGKSFEEYA